VEQAEDDGAGDAEGEHEKALTDEPFTDLEVGALEGVVEAAALDEREEGEEEAVGELAFEHEVDAEKGGGEDVEEVGEPVGEGGDEVGGGGGEGGFGALGDGVDADLVGYGEALDLGHDGGDAPGEIFGELVEVAQYGRQADGEEDAQHEGDAEDEDQDSDWAGGVKGANLEGRDAVDDGDENSGKEGGYVEDDELFADRPGEEEEDEDTEGEDNVPADGAA
jgi:hypothetical protein